MMDNAESLFVSGASFRGVSTCVRRLKLDPVAFGAAAYCSLDFALLCVGDICRSGWILQRLFHPFELIVESTLEFERLSTGEAHSQ